MAEFRALAGPSPNCEAVLVQIEHWAFNDCVAIIKKITKNR